jgi:hypothetical protein
MRGETDRLPDLCYKHLYALFFWSKLATTTGTNTLEKWNPH